MLKRKATNFMKNWINTKDKKCLVVQGARQTGKTYTVERFAEENYEELVATVYKGNIIKNLIMDCQSYTKYRPNETTGGIFVSWRRKEELPTGA